MIIKELNYIEAVCPKNRETQDNIRAISKKDNARLRLRRMPTIGYKNNIYLIGYAPGIQPVILGSVPKDVSDWLAPKIDESIATARKQHVLHEKILSTKITDFSIYTIGFDSRLHISFNLKCETPYPGQQQPSKKRHICCVL